MERRLKLEIEQREQAKEDKVKAAEVADTRRGEDAEQRRREKRLRAIKKTSPGDDLESYLDNLEVTLRQCRVQDEEWIPYMMANLCGDNLVLAQASHGGDDETYMVLKARLLAALGRTARAIGDKLTSLSAKDAVGQTATRRLSTWCGNMFLSCCWTATPRNSAESPSLSHSSESSSQEKGLHFWTRCNQPQWKISVIGSSNGGP